MTLLHRPILTALSLSLTAPLAAQTTAPSAPQIAAPVIDRSAPAPKPTPAQYIAFKAAFDSCPKDDPASRAGIIKSKMIAALEKADKNPNSSARDGNNAFVGAISLILFADLPYASANYDKLTPAQQEELTARTGVPRLEMPSLCPYNAAGLPMLRWVADKENFLRSTRSLANAILGLLALEGIGDRTSPADARAYFLKSYLFSMPPQGLDTSDPRLWSDGIDNDLFANIERQGLQAYFDRTMAGASGFIVRRLRATELAQSNPDKMRALLMSGGHRDALLLIELEESGEIPARHTPADLKFWQGVYDDLDSQAKLIRGPRIAARIALTEAELKK